MPIAPVPRGEMNVVPALTSKWLLAHMNGNGDLLGGGHRLEGLDHAADEIADVVPRRDDAKLSVLETAEIQQIVDETIHDAHRAVDQGGPAGETRALLAA